MDFTQLTYALDGPLALIGLNRPAKRNAISDALIAELQSAVGRAGREARVGILHGHGDHFSAGLDLAEQLERTPIASIANSRLWHRVFDDIERGPIPFVAALRGGAIGGGFELAAAAHIEVRDAVVTIGGASLAARNVFANASGDFGPSISPTSRLRANIHQTDSGGMKNIAQLTTPTPAISPAMSRRLST